MTITLNGTTGIVGPNGTASAPAMTGSDTDTGIVYGTNTVQVATGGTTAVTVDSSQNVGIGTASPSSKLHVKNGSNGIEVYPSGTWTGQVYNANDASGSNGLVVGNRWAADTSTVFEAGSIYGNGSGSWSSYYKITGGGTHIWGSGGAGTERMRIDSSGNLLFNSGYGSVATAYGCRAWVNFNGTGTVAIRGSGNVSSITDNGVGNYTVNFTSSMPDGTYSTVGSAKTSNNSTAGGNNNSFAPYTFNTGAVSMLSIDAGSGAVKDSEVMTVAVFR